MSILKSFLPFSTGESWCPFATSQNNANAKSMYPKLPSDTIFPIELKSKMETCELAHSKIADEHNSEEVSRL